ncbi:ImmA/IrrE family metallo-endopeptidase [Candidatus Palauibacter sp.]|uniref:ImmA/IrrE family metallo-endopeptidase n=1 Tax=Candidatus Palauibacter sp. TaxID=3101350 RepID=UPI003B013711
MIEDDLPERINGLACQVLRGGKPVADAVLVSSRTNVERKRSTLAHELAHRMIRSTGNPAIRLEAAMNRFAGAFLVPGRHLLEEAGEGRRRITCCEIIRLKHMYGVPAAAMLVRLGQVGVLTPAAVRRAFRTFARSWRRSEPEPLAGNQGFAAFEKPQRFRSLVWRAVGEELISPVRAATLLNESLDVVERQVTGPANR